MIRKMDHVGLIVQDLDRQLSFYRDVIGLKVTKEWESIAPPGGSHTGLDGSRRRLAFLADDAGFLLELVQYLEPASPPGASVDHHQIGSLHLCFLTDDIQQHYEALRKRGLPFLTPPKLARSGNWLCYGQDPEGNWIELKEEKDQAGG